MLEAWIKKRKKKFKEKKNSKKKTVNSTEERKVNEKRKSRKVRSTLSLFSCSKVSINGQEKFSSAAGTSRNKAAISHTFGWVNTSQLRRCKCPRPSSPRNSPTFCFVSLVHKQYTQRKKCVNFLLSRFTPCNSDFLLFSSPLIRLDIFRNKTQNYSSFFFRFILLPLVHSFHWKVIPISPIGDTMYFLHANHAGCQAAQRGISQAVAFKLNLKRDSTNQPTNQLTMCTIALWQKFVFLYRRTQYWFLIYSLFTWQTKLGK